VTVDDDRFSGSVLDVFRPFTFLTAAAVLIGYIVLGAGWLHLKTTAALRTFAERTLRVVTPVFVGLAAAACIAAAFCQCRLEFPQMCRSKNPQFGGYSVISRLDGDRWLRFWEADRGGAAAVPGLAS
jgi:cytochrome bd-type quinol oxidase subunit 2